jgi:hypothetical protein
MAGKRTPVHHPIRMKPCAAAPPPEGRGSRQLDQAPVTDDYPFERPWTLVDATIDRVIVDVSGEPYLDLETEMLTMMSRD